MRTVAFRSVEGELRQRRGDDARARRSLIATPWLAGTVTHQEKDKGERKAKDERAGHICVVHDGRFHL